MAFACEHAYFKGQCPFCVVLQLRREKAELEAQLDSKSLEISLYQEELGAAHRRIRALELRIAEAHLPSLRQMQARCTNLTKKLKKLEAERDA